MLTTSIRTLIVDDEPGMRKSLTRIMKSRGYDVLSAASGEEAIALADEHAPQCVLMDIRMPGINGVEAYTHIRQRHPDVFGIFMTAYASSNLVNEARTEGAVEVLSKPFDPEALCALLDRTAGTRPLLVVDDDEGFTDSLVRILEAKGYEVYTASNAGEAVSVYEKRPRCVVLLDMRLGSEGGLEVLEASKAINDGARIILMSGHPELVGEMERGVAMSAAACFAKPLDIDSLIDSIEQAIANPKGRLPR